MTIIDLKQRFPKRNEDSKENTENQDKSADYKVTRLASYFYLKKYKQKTGADSSSMHLKRGIVVKMHQLRREKQEEIETSTNYNQQEIELIEEELLSITSKFVEYILNSNISTMEILNKYSEFKAVIEKKMTILLK